MCVATAALVVGAAGLAMSAAGTIQQGEAMKSTAAYQAQVAKNNAKTAEQNADYAAKAGEVAGTRASLKSAGEAGALRTAIAANGVDVNSGSAVELQASQREGGKVDTLTTLNNAMLQSYGYRTQATNFEADANLKSAESANAMPAAETAAAGGLLQGASSLGFKWSAGGTSGPKLPTDSGSGTMLGDDYGLL